MGSTLGEQKNILSLGSRGNLDNNVDFESDTTEILNTKYQYQLEGNKKKSCVKQKFTDLTNYEPRIRKDT